VSAIVLCEWRADQSDVQDTILRQATQLAHLGGGGLMFLASDAATGKLAAALRHASQADATAFASRMVALAPHGGVVASVMVEHAIPQSGGMGVMFP
jgi:hypothetical protein